MAPSNAVPSEPSHTSLGSGTVLDDALQARTLRSVVVDILTCSRLLHHYLSHLQTHGHTCLRSSNIHGLNISNRSVRIVRGTREPLQASHTPQSGRSFFIDLAALVQSRASRCLNCSPWFPRIFKKYTRSVLSARMPRSPSPTNTSPRSSVSNHNLHTPSHSTSKTSSIFEGALPAHTITRPGLEGHGRRISVQFSSPGIHLPTGSPKHLRPNAKRRLSSPPPPE